MCTITETGIYACRSCGNSNIVNNGAVQAVANSSDEKDCGKRDVLKLKHDYIQAEKNQSLSLIDCNR